MCSRRLRPRHDLIGEIALINGEQMSRAGTGSTSGRVAGLRRPETTTPGGEWAMVGDWPNYLAKLRTAAATRTTEEDAVTSAAGHNGSP